MDNSSLTPPETASDQVPDPVKDAEAAVAALAESFLEWITADIEKAKQALETAQQKPGDNVAELREIYGVVHNVKGQGGSFGYDLLTKIGGSMCDYLRSETASASAKQLKVVAAHFAAMDFVLEKNIQGAGGDVGTQLIGKIQQLVSNIPAPE
ncbi:MAG: Hpt domain-containing protein [Alphaproteobacteria bacterium]